MFWHSMLGAVDAFCSTFLTVGSVFDIKFHFFGIPPENLLSSSHIADAFQQDLNTVHLIRLVSFFLVVFSSPPEKYERFYFAAPKNLAT